MTEQDVPIPKVVVQTRAKWSDPWIDRPTIKAVSFKCEVAPSIPSATFRYEYGLIDDGWGTFAQLNRLEDAPLSITPGHFVRIAEIVQTTPGDMSGRSGRWVGVLTGVGSGEATRAAAIGGTQHPVAAGLEMLLDRCAVDGSIVENAAGTGSAKVDSIIPFNFQNSNHLLSGNRSSTKYASTSGIETYVFSDTGTNLWTVKDICEYLLAWFASSATMSFSLQQADNLANLEIAYRPVKTVRACLNDLIDRRRGHAWTINALANDNSCKVMVWCAFESAITVGGITISPSPSPYDLAGEWLGVRDVQITDSAEHRYDKIVVRGNQKIVLGTVSFDSGTLEYAWSVAAETAYKAANDTARAADQFRHVFTTFRMVGDASLQLPSGIEETWGLKRLMRHLPLMESADDTEAPADFRKPFVVASMTDGGTTKYYMLDRLNESIKGAPSMHLQVLDSIMGFRVSANPGYLLALNNWAGAAAGSWTPQIDYTTLQATVAWASDECLKVEVDTGAPNPSGETKTLRIDIPDAEYWYQLANTVTDVQDGSLVTAGATVLRDDTAKLNVVAAMAKAWYGRVRKAATITYDTLPFDALPALGCLIAQLTTNNGSIPLGTMLTSIEFDIDKARATIKTDFSELDFTAFGGKRGGAQLSAPSMSPQEARDSHNNLPVRLASGSATNGEFPVLVTKYSGVAGSATAECTWKYTVKALDDTTVLEKDAAGNPATEVAPETPRFHYTAYWYAGETRTAPAGATSRYGLACRDSAGNLKLLICYGEIAKDGTC